MNNQPLEILLVEDNPGDVELIRESLQGDHVLHIVSDGVETMAFLRKEGMYSDKPIPDIVLLDINLPKKNGHEVLEEIRADEILSSMPVVILTTSDQDKDVMRSYSRHANGYITKPATAAEFISVVKGIEEYWLRLATLPRRH